MNKKKMILAGIHMTVIIVCLSLVTTAWFSLNRQIKNSNIGMTIQSVSDVATLSCYALRYDGTIGAVCYKIGEHPENGEVQDVEMTEFDRIFRDRSVNTPLIYVVELANVPESGDHDIIVKIPCNEHFIRFADGAVLNSYTADSNSRFVIQRFISNIVSVKVACGDSITTPTPTTTQRIPNNVQIFTTQQAVFRDLTDGDSVGQFASVTDNDTVFDKQMAVQVKISQAEYASKLYEAEDDQGIKSKHLMLYIQFDYDQKLMDAFIEHMMDDSEGDVAFDNDFGTIQILVKAGGN